MRSGDFPLEDQSYSSSRRQETNNNRLRIHQLTKKAHKTMQSIQQYIENTDCDQLGDRLAVGKSVDPEIHKYNNNEDYYSLYFHMYRSNESSMAHLDNLTKKIAKMKEELTELDKHHRSYSQKVNTKTKKKNRRISSDIIKDFLCPYQNCYKEYGSDVSLNLHIKIKHGGGNKSDRDKLAELICQAEIKKAEMPKMNFNLPPGFLNQYRKKFQLASRETFT